MEEKFAIVLDKIIDPYEFSYRRKNEKNDDAYQKGAIDDVVPADVELNIDFSRKWTHESICHFKSILLKNEKNILFQPNNIINGISFGKLYIRLPNRQQDVSDILVRLDVAHYCESNVNVLAYEAHGLSTTCNETQVQIEPIKLPSEREFLDLLDTDRSYFNRSFKNALPEKAIEYDQHSSTQSSLTFTIGSESVVTMSEISIKDFQHESDTEDTLPESQHLFNLNDNFPDESTNGATKSPLTVLPDYMLEETATEIDGERYVSEKCHRILMKETEKKCETNVLMSLIQHAKPLDDGYGSFNTQRHFKINVTTLFTQFIGKYLNGIKEYHMNQLGTWCGIMNRCSTILVGEINFFMYTPAICDMIFRIIQNKIYDHIKTGPLAIVFASSVAEAEKIYTFCAVTLSKYNVHMDLDTPSSSIVKQHSRDSKSFNCKVLIVLINRINILTSYRFNTAKCIIVDGMHLLREEQISSFIAWSNNTFNIQTILTSKYYFSFLKLKKNSVLMVKSSLDLAKFGKMHFLYRKIDASKKIEYLNDQLLLNRAEKWAIVCSNYDELTILRNWLRSCKKSIDYFIERNVPGPIGLLVCTDDYLQNTYVAMGNFNRIIHFSLPNNLSTFEQRFFLIRKNIWGKLNANIHGRNVIALTSVILTSMPEESREVNKLLLQLVNRRYHKDWHDTFNQLPANFTSDLLEVIKSTGNPTHCPNTSDNPLHLIECDQLHFTLPKSMDSQNMKIVIVNITSPNMLTIKSVNEFMKEIHLTKLVPFLNSDWLSKDTIRCYDMFLSPYNEYKYEAIGVFTVNSFTYAHDIIVRCRDKMTKFINVIHMKEWLIEQEIAKLN